MRIRNLALLLLLSLSTASARSAEPAARIVHVSGQGTVEVVPDRVVLNMTVKSVDDDLLRVRDTSDKDAKNILTGAKKYGASDSGFRVSKMQLSLEFNEQLRRQIYTLDRDISVEINDVSKLDYLLLDLLHVSNLTVKDISFSSSKAERYEAEALQRAVADARHKAQFLADLNGLKLGKAVDIRVHTESETPFVISVIPVVGSAKKQPSQRGTARHQSQNHNNDPFGAKSAVPSGAAFLCAAPEAVANSGVKVAGNIAGKAADATGGKPFGVGTIGNSASVEIDFEMHE